jgi:hypothetical protein
MPLARLARSLLVLVGFYAVRPVLAQECIQEPARYQGLRVSEVLVSSPLGFFAAVISPLSGLPDSVPLKPGAPFDVAQYSAGVSIITRSVRSNFADGFSALRVIATVGRLEKCTSNTVAVRYVVYTAMIPPLSGSPFETRQAQLERPATTGAALGANGRFLFRPAFGYNPTRRAYGGGAFTSSVPFSIFDSFEVTGTGSPNSAVASAALSGTKTPARQFLGQMGWNVRASYYDVPAGATQLVQGKLLASFFGSTKQLRESTLSFHYGASVSSGHQQGAPQDAPNSAYGDLKVVSGIEGRVGMNAFAGSYGFQLGSTFSGHSADFLKHILDLKYSGGFTPLPRYLKLQDTTQLDDRPDFIGTHHSLLSVEARLSGGLIQNFGPIPSVERFFGGNQSYPFIDGQPWDVHSGPYIRSIPENGLGSAHSALAFGGTSFYSLNLTVGKGMFGRALLPRELGQSDFVNNLDFGIKTAKGELSDSYFGRDPAVVAATASVSAIKNQIDSLLKDVPTFSFDSATSPVVAPIIKSLMSHLRIASLTADAILHKNKGNETSILLNTQIPAIQSSLEKLKFALRDSAQSSIPALLESRLKSIETSREELATEWSSANTGARSRANAHAEKDFSVAEKVLSTCLYELNAYSVAPVGFFDVARIWPSEEGTRLGVGGGVRLSIVNVNFTLGYAANLRYRAVEGRGALYIKLDVTDMFH